MKNSREKSQLNAIQKKIVCCKKCPRLAVYREKIARDKKPMYATWNYWGKPVPSFGDPGARLLIVGLAPAAHGANRTGRMFTGDGSGNWLFSALYKFGFANQPSSVHKRDGLQLKDCYITAAVHCAPPDNKPSLQEVQNCRPYLVQKIKRLKKVNVVVALGQIAMREFLKAWKEAENSLPFPVPKFAHGLELKLTESLCLICSYHPSQQNTFTGKLNRKMFHAVFRKVRKRIN